MLWPLVKVNAFLTHFINNSLLSTGIAGIFVSTEGRILNLAVLVLVTYFAEKLNMDAGFTIFNRTL